MLRRRGLAPKYEHPGIYCIKLDDQIVYIGKSKKNRDIVNEIGEKEGEFIRKYRPILNTQIPKKEDWHKWDTNVIDARAALKQLLENE